MKTNEIKVTCPECGTEITVKTTGKQKRIDALKAAGISTDALLSLALDRVKEAVSNGEVDADDIVAMIGRQGTVPNSRLFRRWVMAQMFRMMAQEQNDGQPHSVHSQIESLGFYYQWTMMANELAAEVAMQRSDPDNYAIRHRYFHGLIVYAMAKDMLNGLLNIAGQRSEFKLNGVRYKNIMGRDIPVVELDRMVSEMRKAVVSTPYSEDPSDLLYHVRRLIPCAKTLRKAGIAPTKEWVDAYKGAGAYYTMENLIRFHNCVIFDGDQRLSCTESLGFIRKKALDPDFPGWKMFGMLKEMMMYNRVDIRKKRAEWRKRR